MIEGSYFNQGFWPLCDSEEGVRKLVFIILGPFRMALFPKLWNAGRHRLDNLPS